MSKNVTSWQKAESTIIIAFSLFMSHQEACLKIKVSSEVLFVARYLDFFPGLNEGHVEQGVDKYLQQAEMSV